MKLKCSKCDGVFGPENFYRGGYECKDCVKARSKERYHRLAKDPEFINAERKRTRERNQRLGYNEKYKKLRTRQREQILRDAKSSWIARNPEKRRVHIITDNAIRDGRLVREPCKICGSKKVQAHHDDYTKPLDVIWLCAKHHAELHNRLRELELAAISTSRF